MKAIQKYMPFITSALLMCIALVIIYPHYQYYIDPDGTSYLTISKRYATGDYLRAINGYWSPWSCWLTAFLIKQGIEAIPSSVIINALGSVGFIYISQSFFLKFRIQRKLQWLFSITLGLFMCYAIFWQSFDDIWECFFLLSTLRIMLANGFSSKPWLWISTGLIGALAYFAKAYSFPFFILNTVCCAYFLTERNAKKWLKICLVSCSVMVVCSLPWIFALHYKYGIWTTSTAGSLNMSWYLVGHPYFKPGIGTMLPPPYPDSPYYWEDPYVINGDTPHFWSSWHLFGLQFLRLGLNMWKLLVSTIQLSVFFPLIAIAGLCSFRLKRSKVVFTGKSRIMILSFLLFPLGYVLINFESRYLWYMLPLSMVMGAMIIERQYLKEKKLRNTFIVAPFACSYLIFPFITLYKIRNVGYNEFQFAQRSFIAEGIKGTFAATVSNNVDRQQVARIAFFSGSAYYDVPNLALKPQELLPELRRYKINYFLYNYSGKKNPDYKIFDEQGLPIPKINPDKAEDVTIFMINSVKPRAY